MRLIDADRLKKAFNNSDIGMAVRSIINDCPTKDAAPVKRGKWVPNNTSIHRGAANCSECGKMAHEWYNYCPNCGAKMNCEVK